MAVLVFLTLFVASVAASLFVLRKLFAVLAVCDSPFCEEFVQKMKAFGFALLPVALFATVGETLSTAFLSAGRDTGVCVQWGVLIAFAVTMCLAFSFKRNRTKHCKEGKIDGSYCIETGPRHGRQENEPE